ncbi:uncharacterized protein LOC124257258 [Haliotis rubra]|uniref:uncharacterized protein LOC124257258 n=1 Tax=Haliotis rubra TaxID=36100 RepID=UPI001EE5DA0A|nr:uncharacterized protein LOC124257258 [Haliotis rubra]
MSLHPAHGVLLTFVFLLLTIPLASSYYFVSEYRHRWRGGLNQCELKGMKYLDARSPRAAEKASRYLGIFKTWQYWSSLQYDNRTASFLWEGSRETVDVYELQWERGEPDLSSNYECATFTLEENNAVFKMANCSHSKSVACEGDELQTPDRFRSFSKGKSQKEFCEPNHAGTPVCTFYQDHGWEIQLLKVEPAEAEEDCALRCMGMSECVHFTYIRKSAMVGTCLIHRKPSEPVWSQ